MKKSYGIILTILFPYFVFGETIIINSTLDRDVHSSDKAEIIKSTINGSVHASTKAHIKESTIQKNLSVNGRLEISDSEIHGELEVNGRTTMDKTRINRAHINGTCLAENVTAQQIEINGATQILNGDIAETLEVNGSTIIRSSHIDKTIIHGSCTADALTGNFLEVMGTTNLEGSTIKDRLDLQGNLTTKGCTLGTVVVTAKEVSLTDSTAGSIMVHAPTVGILSSVFNWFFNKSNSPQEEQVVTLAGKSAVGPILFEGGKGRIVVCGNEVTIDEKAPEKFARDRGLQFKAQN